MSYNNEQELKNKLSKYLFKFLATMKVINWLKNIFKCTFIINLIINNNILFFLIQMLTTSISENNYIQFFLKSLIFFKVIFCKNCFKSNTQKR